MREETSAAIDAVNNEDQNIRAVETRPINVIVSNENQNPLLQDTGIANEAFISGLPQLKDQLGPAEDNGIYTPPHPPGPGEPGSPGTSLSIMIDTPVKGQTFVYPLSQGGGAITAVGKVKVHGYSIQSVKVRFGDSELLPASITVDESSDFLIDWKRTSNKIAASSQPSQLTIYAYVTGYTAGGAPITKSAIQTVTVKLTDDIPPVISITKPPTNGFQVTQDANGLFTVALEGTALDNASGVKRVEYSLDGWNFTPIITATPANWKTKINLPFKTIPQTISIRAIDNANKFSAVSQRIVRTIDTTKPALGITVPKDGVELPGTDAAGATLPLLKGYASDAHSGVQRVEWSLNNSAYKLAKPKSLNNWSTWSVQNIAIPGPAGPKKIKVRSFDVAGNFTEKEFKVAVSLQYPPKDPTVQEYFSSLLDFIVRRVKNVTLNRFLKVDDLTAAFYQPFQNLLGGDATLHTEQLRQIRICIEIMREFFAKSLIGWTGDPRVPGIVADLQAAESKYRQRAYETLLNRIGSSFEELRASRLLNMPARRALAQRLGFDLPLRSVDMTAPKDLLQQFLLQPGQFTEADLETLFGLVDTTRDPLQKRDFNPTLLELQLKYLEAGWAAQDAAAAAPIIDPDLIGEVDLRPGINPAYDLWQNRQNWVASQLAAFQAQLKQAQPKSAAGFDAVVTDVLGPIRELQALEAQLDAGGDIEPKLAEMRLALPAFIHLMKLRKLAAAGTLLDSEVDDVASILAQTQKLRSFADWLQEEQRAELVLGPDFFRFPAADESIVLPQISPGWRVTVEARRRWQDTLQSRIDQGNTLRQALLVAIDATEEETLPLLRDGLVKAISVLNGIPKGADALTQRLLIDVRTSGYQKITRVEQAIQTLQNFLIDLRMGTLSISSWVRDADSENEKDFDEELRWMGSYATWYSAMQVFLYPENLLLPTLRPAQEQTANFKQLLKNLRANAQLTPEKARDFAAPFDITEQRAKNELLALRDQTKNSINAATGITDPTTTRLQKIPAQLKEKYYFVPLALALHLQKSGQYLAALDWFQVVYAYDLPAGQRKIYYGLELERDPTPNDPKLIYQRNVYWLKDSLNPHDIVWRSYSGPDSARYDVCTRFAIISLVRCLLDFADAEFTHDTNESLPRARSLYMQALELLDAPEMKPPNVPGLSANPAVTSLKFRAEVNLDKLRGGRNISGLKRQLEQLPMTGQSTGILPLVVANSPFGSSSTRAQQPTPYRYSALIDRAKQLVTIAQQVEATFLATLEKRDVEEYNLLKANQDLGLAQANVQLQNLRMTEAANSLTLAERQKERAEFQVQTYQGFLDAGMNHWERQLLTDYHDALKARNVLAGLDTAISYAEALTQASSGGFLGTGIGFAHVPAMAVGFLNLAKGVAAVHANNIEADIQRHSLRASIENRRQEWTAQLGIGQKDVAISAQQWQLAKDHQNIVDYEWYIAQIQTANAQAIVEFLSRKFTNVELYEWMSGVLQEVYSYFLQQATAMARLAQNQLAFERQEATPLFIKNDYWQPTVDDSAFGGSSERDRRGLTGSARLLQDIYHLDQFAFETDKRKLQLAKTISLSHLAPLELQRFRETGALTFATPMRLFDQDFPGHYLRLIKRVRASVVALIPPNQGIRATLTASGLSRVVTGGDVFQSMTVRRDIESVALTSAAGGDGLFELAPQSDLMLPFEFMGVDTIWNLEMPKAANHFDYRTIADVLLTIEYTALSNPDYRRQIIQQLDRTGRADRTFSFRNQFPDQWYDLHNREQSSTPMTVSFSTTREDFPSNVGDFSTEQVALYFVLADGKTVNELRAQLHFTEQGAQTAIGGEATATPDGIISTRLGNAPSWTPMISHSPFGMWELALRDTSAVRSLFASDAILDIVFALTTSCRTPAWPL